MSTLIIAVGFGASITVAAEAARVYGRHVTRRLTAERVELAEADAFIAAMRSAA